jgi:hypothetical protein
MLNMIRFGGHLEMWTLVDVYYEIDDQRGLSIFGFCGASTRMSLVMARQTKWYVEMFFDGDVKV